MASVNESSRFTDRIMIMKTPWRLRNALKAQHCSNVSPCSCNWDTVIRVPKHKSFLSSQSRQTRRPNIQYCHCIRPVSPNDMSNSCTPGGGLILRWQACHNARYTHRDYICAPFIQGLQFLSFITFKDLTGDLLRHFFTIHLSVKTTGSINL